MTIVTACAAKAQKITCMLYCTAKEFSLYVATIIFRFTDTNSFTHLMKLIIIIVVICSGETT